MFVRHHLRLILSSMALVTGALVLLVSLSKSPTTVLSADGQFGASNRQLYLDSDVLPDHVAYPILMTIDRVKLETSTPEERVFTQIEYASRRLRYTRELLAKENEALALSTATKAHKYLFKAAQESLDGELSEHTKRASLDALEFQTKELETLKEEFSQDADRALIDQTILEGQVFITRLQSALGQK